MSTEQLWTVGIAVLVMLAIAGVKAIGVGIRWVAREIADNVVRSIGNTLQVRWRSDVAEALAPIETHIKAIDRRLQEVEETLETEVVWRPARRDDIDGHPI